jgi:hypothetical protein
MANVDIGLGASGASAQQVHAGANVVVCRISISATTSAGDVLRVGKLPHGAIPTNCVFYTGAAFVANTIHKAGISASSAAFISSKSYSGGVVLGDVALTWQLSLSSDARVLYDYITMTPTSVVTAGHYGNLVVEYVMPGNAP